MKVLCHSKRGAILETFDLSVDVYVSRKKGLVHFTSKITSEWTILFIFFSDEWRKRKIFFTNYDMVYPVPISSLKWWDDFVFLKKVTQKWQNKTLKIKLCDKIVDVVHKGVIKNLILLKSRSPKLVTCFWFFAKKEEDWLMKKNVLYIKKYVKLLVVCLVGTNKNIRFCLRKIFSTLNWSKVALDIISIIFYFLVINISITTFDEIYFCPYSFDIFGLCQDKQKFGFEYKFPYFHCEVENKLLSVCLSCYLKIDSWIQDSLNWFIWYFTEEKKRWLKHFKILL